MEKPEIIIIAAKAKNNVIGKNNQLIWHLPQDLKRFKKLTMGHPMIMGRKTFESFPKPLPGRTHIVISRKPKENSENIIWVDSIEKAINKAKMIDSKIFIIGGGNIYNQTLPLANRLEITQLEKDFNGDTYFPEINQENWTLINKEKVNTGKDFDTYFIKYLKR